MLSEGEGTLTGYVVPGRGAWILRQLQTRGDIGIPVRGYMGPDEKISRMKPSNDDATEAPCILAYEVSALCV